MRSEVGTGKRSIMRSHPCARGSEDKRMCHPFRLVSKQRGDLASISGSLEVVGKCVLGLTLVVGTNPYVS